MKRYYVCRVLGDGTYSNPYRPAIADTIDPKTGIKAFAMALVMATNQDGSPKLPRCLVIAAGQDHALVRNHADIDALPDYPLDVKVSAMNAATKAAAFARLQARGIDVSNLGQADGFRDFIRELGRQHEPTFSEDSFDVQE